MIVVRPAAERGHFDHGWLDTYHTFSFSDYYDPKHVRFRSLRVINEDKVAPAEGFGTHPHADMEIITYVLEGALEHKDSMGTGSVIRPGDVQKMSAGTGITHSEFNHSKSERVHLLQIWIMPAVKGVKPNYQQKHFTLEQKKGRLLLVASQDGKNDTITLYQDANVYASVLDSKDRVSFDVKDGRHAWIQVARGELKLGDKTFVAGDGIGVSGNERLEMSGGAKQAEILLFDLA